MELTRTFDLKRQFRKYKRYFAVLALLWFLGIFWRARQSLSRGWGRFFVQDGKTTLPKKTRKKKTLTISLDKIVLWNPSKDPAVPNYAFVESVLPILCQLCENYDIYLIATVKSVKEQRQVEDLIFSSNLSEKHQLDIRKVIFCQSPIGRSHIVRHIEPHIHVDSEMDVVKQLRLSISRLIVIMTQPAEGTYRSISLQEPLPKNIEVCRNFPDTRLL